MHHSIRQDEVWTFSIDISLYTSTECLWLSEIGRLLVCNAIYLGGVPEVKKTKGFTRKLNKTKMVLIEEEHAEAK